MFVIIYTKFGLWVDQHDFCTQHFFFFVYKTGNHFINFLISSCVSAKKKKKKKIINTGHFTIIKFV
jgi:hypothetical protein